MIITDNVMGDKKIFLLPVLTVIILLFFTQPTIAAISVNITMKDKFSVGEEVFFNYSISSTSLKTITYRVGVECPTAPIPPFRETTEEIGPNKIISGRFNVFTVREFIKPQNCTAYVEILEPLYKRMEKRFTILTKPEFDFKLFICKDSPCLEKSKVFIKGSSIYLDYSTEVTGVEINATLTYPDKTTKQITLPTSVKAEQIGTYTLKATVSKEGYKTKTLTEQFGVIKKEAKIESEKKCFVNNKCEPEKGENYKTCPQDCASGSKDNYCDGVQDNICDPDCSPEEDLDCKRPFPYLESIIIIIGLIILVLSIKYYVEQKKIKKILERIRERT